MVEAAAKIESLTAWAMQMLATGARKTSNAKQNNFIPV